MEKLTIGGAEITITDVGNDMEGRTVYEYAIRFPNGLSYSVPDGDGGFDAEQLEPGYTYTARDLKSGCQGGTECDGMTSLLSFLGAAAESYRYHHGMKEDSNTDLFPEHICEWAAQNSDEISMAAYEYENPPVDAYGHPWKRDA
jgi:hypothetical protein